LSIRIEEVIDKRRRLTGRVKIDLAAGNMAAGTVVDAGGDVEAIDEGNVIVIVAVRGRERPFSESGGWDTGTGVRIAFESTVATAD
jgi:hypothetical protein